MRQNKSCKILKKDNLFREEEFYAKTAALPL